MTNTSRAERLGDSAYSWRHTTALVGFFLSGFAALVYEVCWIREASLAFGSTTYALSTVLAVFFLGFAIGSALFAKWGQSTARPMVWFAALELTLGGLALATPALFDLTDQIYGWAYQSLGYQSGQLVAVRVVLVAVVLLLPTVCMGGTLPLVCRQFVDRPHRIAHTTGFLYGLNTIGAAAGTLLAGLVLIPTIGVHRSIQLAAAVNFLVAATVAAARIPALPAGPPEKQRGVPPGKQRGVPRNGEEPVNRRVVYALFFLIGAVALGNEVLWTRFLSLVMRTTVYTYTVTLFVVLVGIAVGSLIASRWIDRSRARVFWFGLVQVTLGLVVLVTLLLPPETWRSFATNEFWACGLLLAPAALLSGIAFPLVVRIVTSGPESAALNVGRLAAVNTVGGIVGSLAMGFAALPIIGLHRSLMVTSGLSLLGGFVAWLVLDRPASRRGRFVAIGLAALLWVVVPWQMGTNLPGDYLVQSGELIDFREGLAANVAVVRNQEHVALEIDRWWQGEDRKTHQIMAAHLPMLVCPNARDVLVVGGGTGQTLSRFLMYDIRRLDCVEIEPAVFEIVGQHFDADWMNDPRVRIIDEDGRNFLAHGQGTYDVISLELGQLSRPGVASFYTEEFYRQAGERLSPGGVLCQFVPAPFFQVDGFRSALRTFADAFAHCYLWYNTAELLLIGSHDPLELRAETLEQLAARDSVRTDLEFSYWGGPDQWLTNTTVLLGCFLAGPEEIEAISGGAAVYRDDRPVLEYAAGKVEPSEINEIEIVELLRGHLADVDVLYQEMSPEDDQTRRAIRAQNLGDMVADGYLRNVDALRQVEDYEGIIRLLTEAIKWNPDNVQANRLLADTYVTIGRFEASLPYYQRALATRPLNPLVRRGLGVALHRLNRPQQAIEHYRTALEFRRNDAELHNNLGVALAQLKQLDDAISHFRRALEIDHGHADARRNLQRALSQ